MAEEFHGGISGETWWNIPSRSVFGAGGYMSAAATAGSCYGGGWFGNNNDFVSSMEIMKHGYDHEDDDDNNKFTSDHHQQDSGSDGQTGQRRQQQQTTDSDSGGSSVDRVFMDSTLQMMELGLSSSSPTSITDWNTNLMLNMDSSQDHQIQKDEDSTICSSETGNFGYPAANSIIDSLFEPDEQSIFNNNRSISCYNNNNNNNNMAMAAAGSSVSSCNTDHHHHHHQILPTTSSNWANNNNKLDCFLKPSLNFSNNTPFWNATASNSFLPNCTRPLVATKPNINEERRGMEAVVKKATNEPQFKRPRIETPSPLPTFKVRKEKLGDRITAIQQLVSPFGKTDTASVLHEAIEYIKFLHDQVNVLSTAYMKNGGHAQYHHQCVDHKFNKDQEVPKQDLKSRGLCLVPISSTFPVSNEANTPEFWTPTFGGTFR